MTPGSPGQCYAVLEMVVSSTSRETVTDAQGNSVERPAFEIPYSIVVVDDAGTQIAKDEGTLTAAKDMVIQSQSDESTTAETPSNTPERMTVRRQITIEEMEPAAAEGQTAVEKNVQIRAKFEADTKGIATVESAQVEVYVMQFPMEAAFGILGALGGAVCGACGGGVLVLIGLILWIVGSGQSNPSDGSADMPR